MVHDALLLSILNIHRYLFIGTFSLLSAFYDELRKLGLIQDCFVSPVLCATASALSGLKLV